MAAFVRRVTRKTVKVGVLIGGAAGTISLVHLAINDDLDDIPYKLKKPFRSFTAKDEGQKKKIVILGSGWGALSFVRKFDDSLYDVKVVSPRPFFFYTPLLCGSTTGVVSTRSIIEPIRKQSPLGSFMRAECKSVDLKAKEVHCTDGTSGDNITLKYDHLVVAVGAQPNTFGIPGVDKYGLFLKEVEHGIKVRRKLLNCMESANVAWQAGNHEAMKKFLNFVVVGGGPTGVEFCAELSDFLCSDFAKRFPPELKEHVKVTLVEALPGILTMFDKSIGLYVQEHLAKQGVDVLLKTQVKQVDEHVVHLKKSDGSVERMDYGMLVWVAGVGMRPFTKQLCEQIGKDNGQTDRRGLLVDSCLRVVGTAPGEVFAIGDCAVSGKPPTAQVAAQQGKYLGRMFRLGSQELITDAEAPGFKYNHQGSMAYIGESQGATQMDPNSIFKLGNSKITDHMFWRALYGDSEELRLMGPMGFAVWRSVYFSKLYSDRGRFSVASDWIATYLFGRNVASPVMNLTE